ncbi:MAG: hypothetical protein ABIG61_02710 [Planctomycetota bacterium]
MKKRNLRITLTQQELAGTRPDVIIAINDPVAIGAYRYLKEKGIDVPNDTDNP